MKLCSVAGCTRPFLARGFCATHYARWRKDNLDKIARSPEARFLAKVTKTETCWLWIGGTGRDGYGRFKTGDQMHAAHRWAYENFVGRIPGGLTIDHVLARGCVNHNCVNPAHLEPVTTRENSLRAPTSLNALNVAKTACPQGHEYNEANTYLTPDGRRDCRACRAEAGRRCRARKKVAA